MNSDEQVINFLNANVRHYLPSFILSLDDEPFQPNSRLIDLSLSAIGRAKEIDLAPVAALFPGEKPKYINQWPGEQYKLLAAFVEILEPRIVIEIGTAAGGSCLTMKKFLPGGGKIITYDIVPWDRYPGTGLKTSDFDAQLEQRIIDLSKKEQSQTQIATLKEADLIFVDAAKDGEMEQAFCDLFDTVTFTKPPIIFFDDIRFANMVKIWREIRHPKLDLTSFGHWSGTGVVEWCAKNL